MALQTWVARFVVEGGRVTEEGGRLRSFPRRRLDEPDVDLYLLAEPAGAKGEDLGAQALEAIGRLFLQDRLSITGGFVRAVRSTHQTLLEWNRRSVPREQVSIGLTGIVLCGSTVYLAQAGPSLVYLRTNERLKQLNPPDRFNNPPLGEGHVDPALRRFDLAPGDLLVAASVSLEDVMDPTTLDGILARGSEEALPELYLMTRDLPNFALFAVTCFDRPGEEEAPSEPEAPIMVQTRPEPEPRTRTPLLAAPDDVEVETPAPALITPPPIDISRPIVKLRDHPGSRGDYARTTGPPRRFNLSLGQPRLVLVAAAAVLVLLVGAFAVPDLIRENRQEKLALLVDQSSLQLTAALAQEDPGQRRALLDDSRRLSTEALRIDSAHPIAATLHEQASAALATLDAVFDLGPMTAVTTLGRQITGEVSIESVAITGNTAYLLDGRGGRIIAVSLNAATPPTVVFQQGDTYGGTPAKAPDYMTWEGTPQTGRLLVLDIERKLFELRPGSLPAFLPLRKTATWTSVAGIATYDGNLYVLDPTGNQVHRYLPALTGFDSEPSPALGGQLRLQDAVALDVDGGDIFVVLKTGEVHRFRSGDDAGFDLRGIDRPPKSPTGIVALPGASEVYIADSGNKRIIVAGRDGVFRRQFVSNAFTDMRALGIDPTGAQLYVVVNDALLTAPVVR